MCNLSRERHSSHRASKKCFSSPVTVPVRKTERKGWWWQQDEARICRGEAGKVVADTNEGRVDKKGQQGNGHGYGAREEGRSDCSGTRY